MLRLLAILWPCLAHAADESDPDRKVRLLPLRVDTRAALREGLGTGLVFELGTQVARTRLFQVDANVSYTTPRVLLVPGPWRAYFAFDSGADATIALDRWIALGPTAGVGFRRYRQQGSAIDDGWVPWIGLRANTAVLRARRWSLAVGFKATADLVLTRFVLEDSRVVDLVPVEGQIGVRVHFGHGRAKETP